MVSGMGEEFELDESFGYLINRAAVFLRRELHRTFAENGFDITPEQWAVLNRLWNQDGLSQTAIAELTFRDQPNVTRMIDVLERKGIVSRKPDEQDRRAYRVFLTDTGKGLRGKLVPLASDVLSRGLRGIEKDDLERTQNVLRAVYRNLL